MSESGLHMALNHPSSTELGTAALRSPWDTDGKSWDVGWGKYRPTSSSPMPLLTLLACGSAAGLIGDRIQGSWTFSPTPGSCSHNNFLSVTSKACQILLCSHSKSLNLFQNTFGAGIYCSLYFSVVNS